MSSRIAQSQPARTLEIVPVPTYGTAVIKATCPRCRCGCDRYVHAMPFRFWGESHLRLHCPCCRNTWMERDRRSDPR